MITKFDSSYYGTADMENLGYRGTPIYDRCYSKEELARAMHKVVAYAKCMDERGYDTFWMAEHHFQPEGTELIPNLLMMAMHLCGITKNLNIGCGFNIVPMWHPLRLAEDYAMADILTGRASSLASDAATTPARSRVSAHGSSTRTPTARCSRKASMSCSRPSKASRSRTRANFTRSRPRCPTEATP